MKTRLPWEDGMTKRRKLMAYEWAASDSSTFARIAKRAGVSEATVRGVLARHPYSLRTIRRVVSAMNKIS